MCSRSQQAWEAFDLLVSDSAQPNDRRAGGIDPALSSTDGSNQAATKQWADGYLAAFAETAGIQLVTFDRALAAKVKDAVLLA